MEARALRLLALVAPPALACLAMFDPAAPHVTRLAGPVLGALWAVMLGAIAVRFFLARRAHAASCWDHADLLTGAGAALLWTGAGALLAALATGWASLAVVGVLGLGVVYVTATWTAVSAGGDAPWRDATIQAQVVPDQTVEGSELREELALSGVTIRAGMRLFATSRPMRHGAIARYAVGSDASRARLTLVAALGPAQRGEHRAPPVKLWLGDVLGLTRTPVITRPAGRFVVLPRPPRVDGARALLGAGGDAAIAEPATALPTEGTFRIRDYVPGDDTRRIHWVRSLARDRLVVRLPDEVPPADPAVRLVLDNALRGAELLTCRAPDELLDALVRVWLGLARSLADAGARVTLVTAAAPELRERPDAADGARLRDPREDEPAPDGSRVRVLERAWTPRATAAALRLGARVAWQPAHPLTALLDGSPCAAARSPGGAPRQIVVSSRPRPIDTPAAFTWVVVPEAAWIPTDLPAPPANLLWLPFPTGSEENRRSRRRRERRRLEQAEQDRALFSQVICWTDLSAFSGSYVARPAHGQVAVAVIP